MTIIEAFSEEQVKRLTGISIRQLRYWDRTGFFRPAFAEENRRLLYSRIYSFADVASLRVLNVLRNQYSVPLQHLRQVAQSLPQMTEAKWSSLELFVLGRKVVEAEPDTNEYREIVSKQYVISLTLSVVISDTRRDVNKLKERDEDTFGKITRSRNICHNAWVIAGTRIPVAAVKKFSDEGYSVPEIQKEYPALTEADVESAVRHKDKRIAA